jgi:hypothetical protein
LAVQLSSGNFAPTKTDLYNKGLKALFKIHKSFAGNTPTANIYSKLFDTLVKPIVLYNSEIWATEALTRIKKNNLSKVFDLADNDISERLHSKFCKLNLRVGKNTTNIACKAELGRFPLIADIHTRIIKSWNRFENVSPTRTLLYDAV